MGEPDLRVGDVLLYAGTGWFSLLIRIKTWSKYSHCEVYDGSGYSVASRDRIGVGRYDLRLDGLRVVLRPRGRFSAVRARAWFRAVDGQPYDWWGLMAFTGAKHQGKNNWAQFCSEFATRYLRAGGVDPFNGYDADGIAPGEFLKSPALIRVWEAK